MGVFGDAESIGEGPRSLSPAIKKLKSNFVFILGQIS